MVFFGSFRSVRFINPEEFSHQFHGANKTQNKYKRSVDRKLCVTVRLKFVGISNSLFIVKTHPFPHKKRKKKNQHDTNNYSSKLTSTLDDRQRNGWKETENRYRKLETTPRSTHISKFTLRCARKCIIKVTSYFHVKIPMAGLWLFYYIRHVSEIKT